MAGDAPAVAPQAQDAPDTGFDTQQPTPTPAPQAAPQKPAEKTVPMIGTDGSIADIPESHVDEAMEKGGYKYGIEMIDPQGNEAVIPSENAVDAITKGNYKLKDPNQPLYERAMQQSMGGPPQYVDVPIGHKKAFEKAGQEGYEKGGEIGLATLGAAGALAALPEAILGTEVATAPLEVEGLGEVPGVIQRSGGLLNQIAAHMDTINKIIKIGKAMGWTAFGVNEAHRLYQSLMGTGKKPAGD